MLDQSGLPVFGRIISHTNPGFETPLPPIVIMKFACPEIAK